MTMPVTGHNDPSRDVDSVQDAVDNIRLATVTLKHTFSFDRPPVTGASSTVLRTITVSRAVVIEAEDPANPPTIVGGHIPFRIEAAGASVTLRNLRFVGSICQAISVAAVSDLTIENCRFEGVVPGLFTQN